MIEEEEHGFDEDEQSVLRYALEEFNENRELKWNMSDLDFIVSFNGPFTKKWYDEFNIHVESVLHRLAEGKLTL